MSARTPGFYAELERHIRECPDPEFWTVPVAGPDGRMTTRLELYREETMNATNPNRPEESSAATAAHCQTAKPIAPGAECGLPPKPRSRPLPGSPAPARAALLRIELRLQDELDDARQAIADAAESGQPTPFVWPAAHPCWIRTKMRLFGFRPPKPSRPLRPSTGDRLGERLHLHWTTILQALLRCPPPNPGICRGPLAHSTTGGAGGKEETR